MRTTAILSLVLLAATIAPTAQRADTRTTDSPEVALKTAVNRELIDGDPAAALQRYREIVTRYRATAPTVAAEALVQMAAASEKLGAAGRGGARTTYEEILRDFPGEQNAVKVARAKLGAQHAGGIGMVARHLWSANGYAQITIASDGRAAAIGGSPSTSPGSSMQDADDSVHLRDLTSGETTRLKVRTDSASHAYGEWPVLSPDLKQVAYAYAGPDIRFDYQLRIAAAAPDAKARPIGKTYGYMYVNGWAPDGKSVLVTLFDQGARIAWMSTIDGSERTLKSLDWRDPEQLALSPDGKFIAYAVMLEPGKPDRELRVLASDASGEWVVARAPGVNASPVWSRDASRLVFVSDRSGTLGIWSVPVRNGRAAGSPTRLKADVGDIGLIGFTATGSLLYQQRVGSRDVLAMDLDSQAGQVRGNAVPLLDTFLGWNWHPALSPDGKRMAYLSKRAGTPGGWAALVIRSLENGTERVVPTLFRAGGGPGAAPQWLPDGQSLIQPARNNQNNNVLYKVDLKSGEVATALLPGGGPVGAALSPDGRTAYAYSGGSTASSSSQQVRLAAYDLESGRRTDFAHAGAAKAVSASPDGRSIAFVALEEFDRARLYVADADGRNVRPILTSDKRGELRLQAVSLAWDPESRFIYFVRREQGTLWRIAATGGAPALVGELAKTAVGTITLTPDGRRVIFATSQNSDSIEVWALENVMPAQHP